MALSVSNGSSKSRKPVHSSGSVGQSFVCGLIGLTLVVGGDQGGKRRDFLQRGKLVDPSQLERSDQGGEAFGAESVWGVLMIWVSLGVAATDSKTGTLLERFPFDESDVAQVLQERQGRFGDDVQDAHAGLCSGRGVVVRAMSDSSAAWAELTLRYSTKRARNAVKCSARRMLPGTASWSRSCGSAAGAPSVSNVESSRQSSLHTHSGWP